MSVSDSEFLCGEKEEEMDSVVEKVWTVAFTLMNVVVDRNPENRIDKNVKEGNTSLFPATLQDAGKLVHAVAKVSERD